MKIPIAKTFFTDSEIKIISEPLKSGWVVQGPYVQKFENQWSDFTKVKESIAVTSCTTALHLSLSALGFGRGDEAIVPAFTWISTANVVEHLGGHARFCDINPETYNMEPNLIESLITENTKAILPVHLFGLSADMDKIIEIANKHNLYVIEDAACAFGSLYKGNHVGNFGDTGCFSFHPRKSITTGEGGMITTDNKELATKLRSLRDHGASVSDHERHRGPKPHELPEFKYAGYNYRMTDLQASIGTTQMSRASDILRERIEIANKYNTMLSSVDWLSTPHVPNDYRHSYQSYPCMFEPEIISLENYKQISEMRNSFMSYLQDKGISTRPSTHAVHNLEYYSNKYKLKPEDYPNSIIADKCSISLPLYNGMKDKEIRYVSDTIKSFEIN